MSEGTRFPDFIAMLHTSHEKAKLRTSEMPTILVNDEYESYQVQDVKYDPDNNSIVIGFNYDNEPAEFEENAPFGMTATE